MNDFRFAQPEMVHLFWLVIVLAVLCVWLQQRSRAALDQFLTVAMQSRLVQCLPVGRRWASLIFLVMSMALFVVAVMRPQWGLTHHRSARSGAQIMICLDISKSMLAEDAAPNRLERAKAEVSDLLSYLDGDQIGLIAFAGRANVLCPLTPDYGFFKLILDDAGPHSVSRGGTRLEEPIRKALSGFRTDSDAAQAILLITDGEDHDSFVEDAAQEAAERGVKVLAIGFGDEAGSQIEVTDPKTGARTLLRDADGQPVISRLDGQTLRDLALVTQGAYIPAGTGLLDLESIYQAHISPLVRGNIENRGQTVRHEKFQWPLLGGLFLLVAAVTLGQRSGSRSPGLPLESSQAVTMVAIGMLVIGNSIIGQPALAQPPDSAVSLGSTAESSGKIGSENLDKDNQELTAKNKDNLAESPPADPRQAYNGALAALETDLPRAEKWFLHARQRALSDGVVRFRASYNLGWVEVQQADSVLDEDPQQALAHLRAAADQFRDAVRLRPDHQDARHNLEVILRRAIQLADSLAQQDKRNLVQQLDELIETQRTMIEESRGIVEQVAGSEDPHATELFRQEFRQLAIRQRQLNSDAQAVASIARDERDLIMSKANDQRSPEERSRAVQLENLQNHFFEAMQRMGQARSQFRRQQGQRAHRRASVALNHLKQARDQLRDPAELLAVIIGDGQTLANFTRQLAAFKESFSVDQKRPAVPTWLTRDYLEQSQSALTSRTTELAARLEAGLAASEPSVAGPAPPSASPGTTIEPDPQPSDPRAEQFLERIREAAPLVALAKDSFAAAEKSLADKRIRQAFEQQIEALQSLVDAREKLLDLAGLIEVTYNHQLRIKQMLHVDIEKLDLTFRDAVQMTLPFQQKNLQRVDRLGKLISEELALLPSTAGPSEPNVSQQAETQQADRERFQQAQHLLDAAREAMNGAQQKMADTEALLVTPSLGEASDPSETLDNKNASQLPERRDGDGAESHEEDEGKSDKNAFENDDENVGPQLESSSETPDTSSLSGRPSHPFDPARQSVDQAIDHLQALRRLFFTLTQHLRETVQRQVQLNDETERARSIEQQDQQAEKLGPLVPRQQGLAAISGQIAQALDEQSKANPTAPTPDGDSQPALSESGQGEQHAAVARQLAEAGKLVARGTEQMTAASSSLSSDQPDLEKTRQSQDNAVENLAQALALLEPSQQQQEQQQQDQSSDQQKTNSSQNDQKQKDEQQQFSADPSQLLQAVRDREAQRRRDRDRRRAGYEPVEKDW